MDENNQPEEGNQPEERKEAVEFEVYEQTKNDMHKFKRSFLDTQKELQTLKDQIEQQKTANLEQKEDFKNLYEQKKVEAENLKTKLTNLSHSLKEDKKISAVRQEALKQGVDEDFLDLVESFDLSDVVVETTDTGRFNVVGADDFVGQLKIQRPKFFKMKVDPKVNNSAGGSTKEKVYSMQEVLGLQKTDPAKYQDIIMNKRHLIRK